MYAILEQPGFFLSLFFLPLSLLWLHPGFNNLVFTTTKGETMPQARKNALREFAELFTRSQCHFPHTDDSPDHSDILAIKGIGQWTLDYVKMRGERHPDVYLANDLVVRKISEKYPVNANAAAPWRSYLTLQLWQLSE